MKDKKGAEWNKQGTKRVDNDDFSDVRYRHSTDVLLRWQELPTGRRGRGAEHE